MAPLQPSNPDGRRRRFDLSAASWVTIQTAYTQVFGVAVFAIQAPLLAPRAFGLVAIVMVFITLCEAFLESATDALISINQIEPQHYSTINALTVLAGGTFAILLAVAAHPLAMWFNEPQLEPVVRAMAIFPLVAGLGAAPNAATKRAMEFRPLAIRMISGVTVGGVAGVVLALNGMGVWALVAQAFLQRSICVAVLWSSSPLPFEIRLSLPHWRQMTGFAWPLIVARSLTWASGQLPRFILALHLSVTEIGLFSLASRLGDIVVSMTILPRTAVARVELRHSTPASAELNLAVRQLMLKLSALSFPLSAIGAALLPALIHAWLNPKWYGAIVPGQAMLLSAAAAGTFYAAGALFLALTQARSEALVSVLQVVTIVLVAETFAGHGLTAVTIAMAIRPLLLIAPIAALVKFRCAVSMRSFLGAQGFPLIAAAAASVPLWLTERFAETTFGAIPALLGLGALGLAVYAALIKVFLHSNARTILMR